MSLGSEKVSIFEEEKGAHEMRFVSFNDLPEINSKYTKQPMLVKTEREAGRDYPIDFPF